MQRKLARNGGHATADTPYLGMWGTRDGVEVASGGWTAQTADSSCTVSSGDAWHPHARRRERVCCCLHQDRLIDDVHKRMPPARPQNPPGASLPIIIPIPGKSNATDCGRPQCPVRQGSTNFPLDDHTTSTSLLSSPLNTYSGSNIRHHLHTHVTPLKAHN